jgi:hypothetical protein
MNRKAIPLFLAVSLACFACKKADNQQEAASAAPATAAPTPPPIPTPDPAAIMTAAATAAAPAPAGTELATMEDFEQQALDEINPQNLEKELDTLEQQIGK